LWRNIVQDNSDGAPISTISSKFHNSIAQLSLQACKEIQTSQGIQTVALSGGVWQNVFLLEKTIQLLSKNGFDVLIHKNVPANDGGIALGQLMIAAHWMKNKSGIRLG
jgi:hydrogenase maturation protein HypF